jgi:hypothetical protein
MAELRGRARLRPNRVARVTRALRATPMPLVVRRKDGLGPPMHCAGRWQGEGPPEPARIDLRPTTRWFSADNLRRCHPFRLRHLFRLC